MGQRQKVGGRKRHIATDTMGLLLAVVVTAASTQDRDGAAPREAKVHIATIMTMSRRLTRT